MERKERIEELTQSYNMATSEEDKSKWLKKIVDKAGGYNNRDKPIEDL